MFISAKECRIERNRSFYGCFYLGSFDSDQSITVANALRRSLLSDCTGLAIISVKIENVYHEYSTLSGVRDSVLDILLNFKEIVLKKSRNPLKGSHGYKKKGLSSVYDEVGSTFFKPLIGYLKVKGPGVIRAKDLRLPSFIQCVDPNQYIATLAEDGFLNLKFVIMEGKNYYIAPQGRSLGKETIWMDRVNLTKTQQTENFKLDSKEETSSFESLEDNSHFYKITKKREHLLKSLKQILEVSKINTNCPIPQPLSESKEKKSLNTFWQNAKSKASEVLSVDVINEKSKSLNIDAVFNPVTKVNYIIEGYENYIVESYNTKVKAIEDLTSFLDSSVFLETNYPFLSSAGKESSFSKKAVSENSPTKQLLDSLTEGSKIPSSTLINLCTSEGYSHYKGIGIPSSYPKLTVPSALPKNFANLETCVNTGLKQVIVLEIWTNGSLHPREALSMAFKSLSSIFNVSTLKMSNPIFSNTSWYKKRMGNL